MPPPTADDYERMIVAGAASISCRSASPRRRTAACRRSCWTSIARWTRQARLPARVNVMPLRRVDGVPAPVPLPEQLRVGHAAGGHGEVPRRRRTERRDGGAERQLPSRRHKGRAAVRSRANCRRCAARATTPAGASRRTRSATSRSTRCSTSTRASARIRAASPHRIEHFGLPDARSWPAPRGCGVIAAPQTIFIHSLGRNFRDYLPDSLPAAHLSDSRDARRRRPRGAVVGRAGRRGRQPAGRA